MTIDTLARLESLSINKDEILENLYLPEKPYTVFLSGSVIEGYGNAESDLDLFVVYENAVPPVRSDITQESNLISMEYIADWRVDIESWSSKTISAIASRISQSDLKDVGACMAISLSDFNLAHSIRIGLPIQNEENFQHLQQALDIQHISSILTERYLRFYYAAAEDAAGAIVSKQYGTALITARHSVEFALDALMAFHQETNIKEKWRFQKLAKLGMPLLLERYWQLETASLPTQEDVLPYAKDCLFFAQGVVAKIPLAS